MRKIFCLLLAQLLLCGQASLAGFPPGVFDNAAALVVKSGAPTYTGAGDIIPGWSAWWSIYHCYSNAYSGNVAAVWDGATGNTTETLITCSAGGTVNQTLHLLSVTCAVSCVVGELYDQTGNGNHLIQATNADRPVVNLNCLNTSLPCVNFTATAQGMTSAFSTASTYGSTSVVASSSSLSNLLTVNSSTNLCLLYWSAANTWVTYGGSSITATATDSAWHAAQMVCNNGTSASLTIDATTTTGSTGSRSWSAATALAIGTDAIGDAGYGNKWAEGGVYAGLVFTAGNITSLCHNQYTYWATSTSC